MKHLQKRKNVKVKVFYAKNGHFKEFKYFDCALDAKRYVEKMAHESDKVLEFFISDDYNDLYHGDGLKVV